MNILRPLVSPSNRKCSVAVTGVKRVRVQAQHNHFPQSVMCASNSGREHQGATSTIMLVQLANASHASQM